MENPSFMPELSLTRAYLYANAVLRSRFEGEINGCNIARNV